MNRRVAASPLRLLAVFAGLVAGLLPFAVAAANPVPPTPAEDVALLAHPALLGREAGSPQAALASQYIAQRLRGLGLQPFEGDSYFQPVPLTRVSARVGAAELVVQRGDASFTAHYGKEAFVELGGVPDLGAAPLSLVSPSAVSSSVTIFDQSGRMTSSPVDFSLRSISLSRSQSRICSW